MSRTTATALAVLASAFLALPSSAVAQSDDTDTHWGLGIGASIRKNDYTGEGNHNTPLPLIMYENRYVRVLGNVVDLKLPSQGAFSFTLRARYALGDGYDADDAPILRGMAERKGGLWLGGAAAWKDGASRVSLELLGDASGYSKGTQARLNLEHAFRHDRLELTPHISATWFNDKYVDYYYGVRSTEATAGRPGYAGSATTELGGGLRLSYGLRPNQSVFVDVTVRHRGSGISDSPLTDKASVPSLTLGYLYRF